MSVLRQLYQLQLVDNEWDKIGERLTEVNTRLQATGDVARAEQAVRESEDKLRALRKDLNALELEVGSLDLKLKKNQERLYGGKVRNPKELSSLQDEAASLRRRRSELEDDQLELMIVVEEQEAELAERQARHRQIEATRRQQQSELLSEKTRLESLQADLRTERGEARARIGAANLARYIELRDRTGGSPIALLKRGVCQSCGVDVPTGVAWDVERGAGEHDCPICGRLLLYGGG